MWKKIVIFTLIVLVLAGALIALWPTFENMAFEAKLQTITSDWNKQNKYLSLPWYHTDGFGSYYLGADNGYDIFYYHSPDGEVDLCLEGDEYKLTLEEKIDMFTTEIANYTFYPAKYGEILAYKDGEFTSLSILYSRGDICEDAIHAACDSFNHYVEVILHSDPISLNEKELVYYCNKNADYEEIVAMYQESYKSLNSKNKSPMIIAFQRKIDWLKEYEENN